MYVMTCTMYVHNVCIEYCKSTYFRDCKISRFWIPPNFAIILFHVFKGWNLFYLRNFVIWTYFLSLKLGPVLTSKRSLCTCLSSTVNALLCLICFHSKLLILLMYIKCTLTLAGLIFLMKSWFLKHIFVTHQPSWTSKYKI